MWIESDVMMLRWNRESQFISLAGKHHSRTQSLWFVVIINAGMQHTKILTTTKLLHHSSKAKSDTTSSNPKANWCQFSLPVVLASLYRHIEDVSLHHSTGHTPNQNQPAWNDQQRMELASHYSLNKRTNVDQVEPRIERKNISPVLEQTPPHNIDNRKVVVLRK